MVERMQARMLAAGRTRECPGPWLQGSMKIAVVNREACCEFLRYLSHGCLCCRYRYHLWNLSSEPTIQRIPMEPCAQVMDAGDQAVRSMSVQCALEDSCLVFFDDTTMAEALAAFDDTGKTVGMVQGDAGEVQQQNSSIPEKPHMTSSRVRSHVKDYSNVHSIVPTLRWTRCDASNISVRLLFHELTLASLHPQVLGVLTRASVVRALEALENGD